MIPEDEIRQRAEKHGLGHLTDIEMEYINARVIYDHAATSTSMDAGVAFDHGHAYRALKSAVSETRFNAIVWLASRLWYTEGNEE